MPLSTRSRLGAYVAGRRSRMDGLKGGSSRAAAVIGAITLLPARSQESLRSDSTALTSRSSVAKLLSLMPNARSVHHIDGTVRINEENVMAIKLQLRAVVLAAFFTMAACGIAFAQEIPLVTGEQWTKSSEEMKKAYLVGIANVVYLETAYEGPSPLPDTQSFLPRMVKGLKGQTLDSVREALNKWYAAHPDQINRPVIETIWFEMVLPGLHNVK